MIGAKVALDEAAAIETDPLRTSYAWTLSAAVWFALDEAESAIITERLRQAYDSAVDAARAMQDRVYAPPRALRYVFGPLELAVPALVHASSKSVRIELTSSVTAPGIGAATVRQYTASRAALERERQLVEINRFVCELRELLIRRGEPESSLLAYDIRLVPGESADYGMPPFSATFWKLTYEELPPGEAERPCDSFVPLSEAHPRMQLETRRRDGSVVRRAWNPAKHSSKSRDSGSSDLTAN